MENGKNFFGNDHFPIVISLFHNNTAHGEFIKPKLNINFENWPKFQQLFESLNKDRPVVSNINKEMSNEYVKLF